MAAKKVYILGAGNQARETRAIYTALHKDNRVNGFIVQESFLKEKRIDAYTSIPVYDESILHRIKDSSTVIAAIGSPLRKYWVEEIEKKELAFDTVIHPSVSMGDRVTIGKGCIVNSGVVLTCDISIGKHTIINVNTTISHDTCVGAFVTIGPGVNIAGNVTIGNESWIGIGVTVVHNVSIGKGAFIAAGAVVIDSIADNTLVMGIPAKPVRRIDEAYWETKI